MHNYGALFLGPRTHRYSEILKMRHVASRQTRVPQLLARLIERIRRTLSTKHLTPGALGLEIADRVVRARIGWDDTHGGSVPILVIDSREVLSEDFGRMLMSFEGCQKGVSFTLPKAGPESATPPRSFAVPRTRLGQGSHPARMSNSKIRTRRVKKLFFSSRYLPCMGLRSGGKSLSGVCAL